MTFNATIQTGTNTLTINTDTIEETICANGVGSLDELSGWIPVIALIIGAAAVIGVLGFGKGADSFTIENLGTTAITIVFTVIVIAVGAGIIQGAIC
jgi:hypothetical protein